MSGFSDTDGPSKPAAPSGLNDFPAWKDASESWEPDDGRKPEPGAVSREPMKIIGGFGNPDRPNTRRSSGW